MKHFKMCIFNDRTIPMNLQIQDKGEYTESGYLKIPPQTKRFIDIEIADDAVPFFKVWETGQALLAYTRVPQDENI